jgi:hypothetical protein
MLPVKCWLFIICYKSHFTYKIIVILSIFCQKYDCKEQIRLKTKIKHLYILYQMVSVTR